MLTMIMLYTYRLVINQAKKVGTSVIQTISLIRYARISPVDKGIRIIEVALYVHDFLIIMTLTLTPCLPPPLRPVLHVMVPQH